MATEEIEQNVSNITLVQWLKMMKGQVKQEVKLGFEIDAYGEW